MTHTPEEVERVAKGLTKASRRAIVRMGDGWTREGAPGPSRYDAYSLWWGRDGKAGLIAKVRWLDGDRWEYLPSAKGLAVRDYLREAGER